MPSAAEVAVNSVIPERAPPINTHHRLPAQGPTRPAGFAIPAGDNMSAGLFASTGTVMSPPPSFLFTRRKLHLFSHYRQSRVP